MTQTITSRTIRTCRGCKSERLYPVLDLGTTPLANSLLDTHDAPPELRFPLKVALCESCALVQITEDVPPEALFSDYVYFSSFSAGMTASAKELAEALVRSEGLTCESFVVEIASNDGYLLKHYKAADIPVLGVEPAANVAKVAQEAGIDTRVEFFSHKLASDLAVVRRADVIHANNVLAHVPDPVDFLKGVRALLKPTGLVSIEVPYLGELLRRVAFDTVYHEHLFYFSLTALRGLFAAAELDIVGVDSIPLHGGSLRVFGAPTNARFKMLDVRELLDVEHQQNLGRPDAFERLQTRVDGIKTSLVSLLESLRSQGKTIAAYGAAAKGATLLSFCGIGPDLVDYVVDRSTYKVGKFMPGSRLPILPVSDLEARKPDYCLLLAWNFADEIAEQQAHYLKAGGQFIIPVPSPSIVAAPVA